MGWACGNGRLVGRLVLGMEYDLFCLLAVFVFVPFFERLLHLLMFVVFICVLHTNIGGANATRGADRGVQQRIKKKM